jgi:hypothetical protein
MNRTRIDAILSDQRPLGDKTPAARPVVLANDETVACAECLTALCAQRTSARPLALESPQLPPIF